MNISDSSNVAFGGIYLYKCKSQDKAQDVLLSSAKNNLLLGADNPTQVVRVMGKKGVLLINGQDFKDFKKQMSMAKKFGINSQLGDIDSFFKSYADRAVKIDVKI